MKIVIRDDLCVARELQEMGFVIMFLYLHYLWEYIISKVTGKVNRGMNGGWWPLHNWGICLSHILHLKVELFGFTSPPLILLTTVTISKQG